MAARCIARDDLRAVHEYPTQVGRVVRAMSVHCDERIETGTVYDQAL